MFLFPFYYMVIGSLQAEPDTSPAGRVPHLRDLTLDNYRDINAPSRPARLAGQLGHLHRRRASSAPWSSACSPATRWPGCSSAGRGTLFALVLLVQVIPFQLLMIPLYVLIVRDYGLADTYLGMILPFAINSTAVFVFRQFFLQLPDDAVRRGPHRRRRRAARSSGRSPCPLVRPALLTAVLLTFIGPWNEFLWPFLITKQADMQPLAVSLANYISNVAARAANPYRRHPGRRLRAGRAGRGPLHRLPAALRLHRPRLRGEGLTCHTSRPSVPYPLTRLGVVMSPDPGEPFEAEGVLNPASGRTPDGRLLPAAPAGRRRQRLPGRAGRGRAATTAYRSASDRAGRRPRTGRGLGARA